MSEICTDNRFEVIAAYKKKLMERTNIETSPDEMTVIDNVLFRFWQMGWLPPVPHGRLIDADALDKTLEFIGEAEAQIYRSQSWGFAMKCRKALCDAPTVIPAEEGE